MAEADLHVCAAADDELKAQLLHAFCPVLRFDSSEKHFPVSVESFISAALLLRQEIPYEQVHWPEPNNAEPDGGITNTVLESQSSFHSEEADEVSASCQAEADDTPGTGSRNDAPQGDKRPRLGQEQACGECGKREGWRIPRGWTVIPTPAGTQGWTVETLLQEQERTGAMFRFRLEPHCCLWGGRGDDLSAVPCYAFAQRLDESMMAPFLRRAGVGPIFELKYAFLYGYNGTTFAVPGTSVGVHTGDLEHVTVRVDSSTTMLLEVFFAAHSTGEGKWVPSKAFYRQVQALEERAHPSVPEAVPEAQREFLETDTTAEGPPTSVPKACAATAANNRGGRARVVIYPARDGHASYHMPRRWRRFGGLGDDACGGDGKMWRPFPVQLDHPIGKNPPWLQFRGRFGAPGCITSEAFWKFPGEPLRRCSPEAKYRSLVEDGLVPDRGVRFGAIRRVLHGNGDQGIWIVRRRQRQQRMPFSATWTTVPGLGEGRPRDRDPPRIAGRVWLHDWDFVNDRLGNSTDREGWSYHHLGDRDADTGRAGKPKESGLLAQRGRSRIWFRIAGTPAVAREIKTALQESQGRHPKTVLALAALEVAGQGKRISSKSILTLLSHGDHDQGGPDGTTADARAKPGYGAERSSRAVVKPTAVPLMSFAHVASRSLGLASTSE